MLCKYLFCIWANPSWSILNSRLTRDIMVITQEIFYCRVWVRIKILVLSYKRYNHMSALEGQVHHLNYMSCIYHACTGMKNRFPHPRSTILDWKRSGDHCQKKGVRARLIVKRKWRSSKVKWLDTHLLEQVLSSKKEERECLHNLLWEHR